MGVAAVENILSVLDGKPIRDNVVNKEVLGIREGDPQLRLRRLAESSRAVVESRLHDRNPHRTCSRFLDRAFRDALREIADARFAQTTTTILPPAWFASIIRCASQISSKRNTRTGFAFKWVSTTLASFVAILLLLTSLPCMAPVSPTSPSIRRQPARSRLGDLPERNGSPLPSSRSALTTRGRG